LGGYEWRIRFTRNTGPYNGLSFPPGSGNIDPITIKYTNPATIFGTNVKVQTVTYVEGSTPIDGSFTLTYGGLITEPIEYDQQPLETKYALQNLNSIGEVEATSLYRYMQPIPGVFASVDRDSRGVTISYNFAADDSLHDSVLQHLTSGDLIRVGGGAVSSQMGQTSIDGALPYGSVSTVADSPVLSDPSQMLVLPGEELRIGAENYTVVRSGVEVQVFTISCDHVDSTSSCGKVFLTFDRDGIVSNTGCIERPASGQMTSAAELQAMFESMSNLKSGSVYVTLDSSPDLNNYVYSIYFQGDGVNGGDIPVLSVTEGFATDNVCNSVFGPIGAKAQIMTAVNGGYTGVQSIRVNVESGYINGSMFKVACGSESTGCFDFGASASKLSADISALKCFSDQLLPFSIADIDNTRIEMSYPHVGFLEIGDYIRVGAESIRIMSITDDLNVVVEKEPVAVAPVATVSKVHQNAVVVSREGTGDSSANVISITATAGDYVTSGATGYYQLC